MKVATTTSLLGALAKEIGGERVDVVTIILPAACPGHFDTKPGDVKALADARLFLTGTTIAASFKAIGGLLIFSLIANPAAAAYQLTYSLRRTFLVAALFGVLSGWLGLLAFYVCNAPSGAVIIVVSTLIFAMATLLSPKRQVKAWEGEASQEGAPALGGAEPSTPPLRDEG